MKRKNFDLYEFVMKKTGRLNQNNRTDLRISFMMSLKIALLCLWYLYIDDDSKYTAIAISINLISWPIYHLFIVLIEFKYMYNQTLPQGYRKSFYRLTDQLQNLILLIEFCVLVFKQQYNTAFHIVILTFLILDFLIFFVTLMFNLIRKFIRQVQYSRYLDSLPKNSEELANRIAFQIVGETQQQQKYDQNLDFEYYNKIQKQLKEIEQQHVQQNICSHIYMELNNQTNNKYKGDINVTISVDEDKVLVFQQNVKPQQNQVSQNLQQVDDEESSSNEVSERNTLGLFEFAFFLASLTATIVFINIFIKAKVQNETLKWLGIFQIAGDFLIILFSIGFYCQMDKGNRGTQAFSFTKALSTIFQGFVCGITSIFYGLILSIFVIAVLTVLLIVCICTKGKGSGKGSSESGASSALAFIFVAGAIDQIF